MSPKFGWPDRLNALGEALSDAVNFQGPGTMEGRYFLPEETHWGVDLLELAPALSEVAEAGPRDGEHVWDVVSHIDLLLIQEAFDEVEALALGFGVHGQPELTVEGIVAGHKIVVLLYTKPFDDAEPHATIRG